VPAQDGLGLNEQRRTTPHRNEASEQDDDGSIRSGQSRPCDLSARNFELLPQQSVLSDQIVPRAEPVEDIPDDGSRGGPRPSPDSITEAADLVSKARTKAGGHHEVVVDWDISCNSDADQRCSQYGWTPSHDPLKLAPGSVSML